MPRGETGGYRNSATATKQTPTSYLTTLFTKTEPYIYTDFGTRLFRVFNMIHVGQARENALENVSFEGDDYATSMTRTLRSKENQTGGRDGNKQSQILYNVSQISKTGAITSIFAAKNILVKEKPS